MKRISIMISILLLVISMSCFAAKINVGQDGKLTVQLSATTDMSHYDFGFSTVPVLQWATKAVPPSDKIKLKSQMDVSTGGFVASLNPDINQELYVYWRLYSLKAVDLTLSINGNMVNSLDNSKTIRWFVDWESDAVSSGNGNQNDTHPQLDSNTPSGKLIKRCEKLLTLQPNAGCRRIYVYTENLLDKTVSGTYSGSLVLTVEVSE